MKDESFGKGLGKVAEGPLQSISDPGNYFMDGFLLGFPGKEQGIEIGQGPEAGSTEHEDRPPGIGEGFQGLQGFFSKKGGPTQGKKGKAATQGRGNPRIKPAFL